MKRIRQWSALATALLSMVLFAGIASAHVTVQPKETKQGSYEVFAVRVPSEQENVTTKSVKVKVPDGLEFKRLEPKAGWKAELEKNGDGAIVSVTWTAEGDGLAQTEFTEFRLQGKVAADAKELVWKAYQTYSDGTVVEWVGAPDADHPASVTTVSAAAAAGAAAGDGHDNGSAAGADANAAASAGHNDTQDAAADAPSSDNGGSGKETAALVLGIAGAVLGAAALVVAVSKRRQ